jgi:hypothetical protein
MPVVVFKSIKPKALKTEVFNQELARVRDEIATEIAKDYESTVRTWKRKPEFVTEVSMDGGPKIEVSTDDEIYRYVEEGTKPHLIRPRRAKALLFPSGYRAKTLVRSIGSLPGGSHGKTVAAQVVHHPGTLARQFSRVIWERWQPRFRQRMTNALNRAAKLSGQSVE